MIGKLKGKVDSHYDDFAIIDVGGVGYKVYCSNKTLSKLEIGNAIELFIETHVREDHIHLFGFNSLAEQNNFITLQSVKGVGVRMALAILSHLTPEEISIALMSGDKATFTNISGIGKKLAERIVMELKDKSTSLVSSTPNNNVTTSGTILPNINDTANDAISALVNLGINRSEAFQKVGNVLNQHPDADISEIIRLALKK